MRRLARQVFTIFSALSLMLWLAVSFMWLRSLRAEDGIGYVSESGVTILGSYAGACYVQWSDRPAEGSKRGWHSYHINLASAAMDPLTWLPAFHSWANWKEQLIPYWMIWLPSALLPALSLWRRRKKSRREFPVRSAVEQNSK